MRHAAIMATALTAVGIALGGCHDGYYYHDDHGPPAVDPGPIAGRWEVSPVLRRKLARRLEIRRTNRRRLEHKLERREARVQRLQAQLGRSRVLGARERERGERRVACDALDAVGDVLAEIVTLGFADTGGNCAAPGARAAAQAARRHAARASVLSARLGPARGRVAATRRGLEREIALGRRVRAKARAVRLVRGSGVVCSAGAGLASVSATLHNRRRAQVDVVVRPGVVGVDAEIRLAGGERRTIEIELGSVAGLTGAGAGCSVALVDVRLPDQPVAPAPRPPSAAAR